jgi:hypothetical protein
MKVLERDSYRCCRCPTPYAHIHHRRPKRMGGSRAADTDQPQNLILLCERCHSEVHGNGVSESKGYLLRATDDPQVVPVLWRGRWVRLTQGGDILSDSKLNHPSRETP